MFAIKPVRSYVSPRYATLSRRSLLEQARWLLWRVGGALGTRGAALLLAVGLSFGAAACGSDAKTPIVVTDGDSEAAETASEADSEAGETSEEDSFCSDGEIACKNTSTIRACVEHEWKEVDCNAYCQARSGSDTGTCERVENGVTCTCASDADSDLPAACSGSTAVCKDALTLAACGGGVWKETDCSAYCETISPFYSQTACEATADGAACQCYDLGGGGIYSCTAEDLTCTPAGEANVCYQHDEPETFTCEAYCQTFGLGTNAGSCSTAAGGIEDCGCYTPFADGESDGCSDEQAGCLAIRYDEYSANYAHYRWCDAENRRWRTEPCSAYCTRQERAAEDTALCLTDEHGASQCPCAEAGDGDSDSESEP